MEIRRATTADAKDILNIYSHYVSDTAISFEYVVPTKEEFEERIRNTISKYPYLVALEEDKIIGYAYAGVFKGRAAYNHCVETTIYLDTAVQKRGLGRILYEALEKELGKMGITNLYACIAVCDEEDEYLNNNSRDFHEHLGYTTVGRFHRCGYKFDRYYDMVWMEKIIRKD